MLSVVRLYVQETAGAHGLKRTKEFPSRRGKNLAGRHLPVSCASEVSVCCVLQVIYLSVHCRLRQSREHLRSSLLA